MIKITISTEIPPAVFSFEKSEVIIGAHPADVTLTDLKDVHIIIQAVKNQYIAINKAGDPFVTLNGMPFGKKTLRSSDQLQIGKSLILIETSQPILTLKNEEQLDAALEQKLEFKNNEAAFARDFGVELAPDFAQMNVSSQISDVEIEKLLKDLEALEHIRAEPPEDKVVDPSKDQPKASLPGSLKDDYLREYEDRGDRKKERPPAKSSLPNWNWKLIGWFFALLLLVAVFVSGLIYLNVSARNRIEEFKGVAGVADMAMALTYAQMHNIRPQNQNWSDPEFLKNNLLAVLAPEYTPAFTLDNHGQFSNSNYFLRIYTSSDLTQFVVVAQPVPGLLQWLVPKATIIIDSTHMEMRKVRDIKALNRLLAIPTNLDGTSANEVSNFLKSGEVISLHTLSTQAAAQGFMPPKALALIHPGAENYIYNAPRYYRFGENFLTQAYTLVSIPSESQEVDLLKAEMQGLSKYPHVVLYSSSGMQWAAEAQRALNTFVPNNKLLIAYLKFNAKRLVSSSHLLMDQGPGELAYVPKPVVQLPSDPPLPVSPATPEKSNSVEDNHPLYIQLVAIREKLQQPGEQYQNALTQLIESADTATMIDFLQRLQKTLRKGDQRYVNDPKAQQRGVQATAFFAALEQVLETHALSEKKRNEETIQALTKLYQEYASLPLAQFATYIKAAGLEQFVQGYLQLQEKAQTEELEQIESKIHQIHTTATLNELHQCVEAVSALLTLEKIPDPKKLIAYQTEIRQQVVEKLNDFLLSSTKSLPHSDFRQENRSLLANILRTAWVVDPDEFEFYMTEFELRTSNHPVK